MGAWFRELRGERSQREVAASAGISERTLQRYESDQGPSYEMLRLLEALGVELNPPAPSEAPRAVNAELASLRALLEGLRGDSANGRHELSRSLEAIDSTLESLDERLDALAARVHDLDARLPEAGSGGLPT